MIVISKKRIRIIVSCILIAAFAFSFQIAKNQPQTKETKNTVETTATPVSGKTIVIDARTSEFQMKEHKAVPEQPKHKLI